MEGATPSAPSIGWLRRLDLHTAELTGCVPVFVRLEESKPPRRRSTLHIQEQPAQAPLSSCWQYSQLLAVAHARRCSRWPSLFVLAAKRALAGVRPMLDVMEGSTGVLGAAVPRVTQLMAACANFACLPA